MAKILDKRELLQSDIEHNSPYGDSEDQLQQGNNGNSWDVDEGMPSAKILQDVDVSKIKWTNRRKHAWISIIALSFLMVAVLILVSLGVVDFSTAVPLLQTIVLAYTGIIFAYMGFTSLPMLALGKGK